MYRTGDLVKRRSDGAIEYLGRRDHQVKVLGARIEIGEIEAVLVSAPSVHAAAVVAREDEPGKKRLVAYVVLRAGTGPAADLRAYLEARLPRYMVPAAFVVLDAFPLSPNGKLDRRALPAPPEGWSEDAAPFVAPATPAEEKMAAIWTRILSAPRIGVHDNFFAIGGDSLLAAQVIARMRDAFGVPFSMRSFFEAPTIAELAKIAERF